MLLVLLMVLVLFLDAGAAAQHALLAGLLQAEHVEYLSEMVALLLAGQVFHLGDCLHLRL